MLKKYKISQEVTAKLKKIWKRFLLRGVSYSDNSKKLDTFYMVKDPWSMDSPSQNYRFVETNRIILEKFEALGSLLEIGCGEGHQSIHLQQTCNKLTGLDMSARAVKRALTRCPHSEFLAGDIFSREFGAQAPFDLVVACEVLYYMSDVPAALTRMRALGRKCLVTYFYREMKNLDHHLLNIPGIEMEVIEFEHIQWRVSWWSSDQV